jgi:hypothetical protein
MESYLRYILGHLRAVMNEVEVILKGRACSRTSDGEVVEHDQSSRRRNIIYSFTKIHIL